MVLLLFSIGFSSNACGNSENRIHSLYKYFIRICSMEKKDFKFYMKTSNVTYCCCFEFVLSEILKETN